MPTITTSQATRITYAVYNRVKKEKNFAVDRSQRPFLNLVNKMKKSEGWTGDKIVRKLTKDSGLSLTTWTGTDTLTNDNDSNFGFDIEFGYANFFMATRIIHDEIKKMGIVIVPNDNTQSAQGRGELMSNTEFSLLTNYLTKLIESLMDGWDARLDLALHRQGATAKDIVGLNGLLPINRAGTFAGWNRNDQPLVQHPIFAGTAINESLGLGATGTSSSGGTLGTQMDKLWRQCLRYCGQNGIPGTLDAIMAGAGFIDKYKAFVRANNDRYSLDVTGQKRIDIGLPDASCYFNGIPIIWDPTLDDMDVSAASEVGLPTAVATCTGAGGTPTRAAVFAVQVTSGGAVDKILVLDVGSGYASAPTLTVTGAGAATATCTIADGKIATTTVTAAGSTATVPTAVSFTNRAYFLNTKSWEYIAQPKLDKTLSIPADPATSRVSYLQLDGTYFLMCNAPRANGIIAAS